MICKKRKERADRCLLMALEDSFRGQDLNNLIQRLQKNILRKM